MINIKQFGDIHANKNFSYEKLSRIEDAICDSNTDYVLFTGDLIHSNDYIRNNASVADTLLNWIERIASNKRLIMVPGNHDIFSMENNKWVFDIYESFWNELASIEGVSYIPMCKKYEDELIYVTGLDLGYNYYEHLEKTEDKEYLLEQIKLMRDDLTSLDKNKLNIFLSHSPVYMTDNDVLELLNEFNLILSGHMHNGCVLPFMDKLLPKNRGIISPKGNIFPSNARDIIDLNNEESKLVITGGISKIIKDSSLISILNNLFPMEITEIEYNPEDKSSKVKQLHL